MAARTYRLSGVVLLKGALLLACALSFWPYLAAAGIKGQTGDYSHVFIIPPIAAVVYLRSTRRTPSTPRPGVAGVLLGMGLVLRAAGEWYRLPLLAEAAFPPLFIGLIEILFGHAEALRVVFPAVFLLFGFGFVTDVLLKLFVGYLMLLSTGAAYDAVTTLLPQHGPYIVSGNMIFVPPHARFDVIEACAGIRGLLALFVIGSLYGYTRRLTIREALRFVFLLTLTGLGINLVRISATIVASLLLRDRVAHTVVHDTVNWIVFGPMILLLPAMVRRARAGRLRIGLIGGLAALMVLAHMGQWHLRATQGNTRLILRQAPGAQQPSATLEVDQQGLPRALLPYVSPTVDGKRHWRWILTSGLVHCNVAHLTVNVALLLVLGHRVRQSLPWPWVLSILAGGQVVGALTAWLTLVPAPDTSQTALAGASCAVSGLFGAYLVVSLAARRRWGQAVLFLAVYSAGLWLSASRLSGAHSLSVAAHLAGLGAGACLAALARRTRSFLLAHIPC
jgi:exosortase